ncbi:uncharacterized protein C8A04DRAFT_23864 [Dichotomopilus funicola]|uniref:Uncharacterized protein n=1 Tax=Dichotomopilus funicola TaxID=1934379 RepID=A0AAN6ZT54_9PEZI|nr:hypothetical protein C8A04DRAFT_23864 [Dichotomopilus funicola]
MPGSSDTSEILARYEGLVTRLHRLENVGTAVVHPPGKSNSRKDNELCTARTRSAGQNTQSSSGSTAQEGHASTEDGAQHTISPMLPEGLPSAGRQVSPKSDGPDADEAWKLFIFGDDKSEELERQVFEEAERNTVLDVQTSTLTDPLQGRESDEASNVATVGTGCTGNSDEIPAPPETCSGYESPRSLEVEYQPTLIQLNSRFPTSNSSVLSPHPGAEVDTKMIGLIETENSVDTSHDAFERHEYSDSRDSGPDTAAPSTTSLAVEVGTATEQFRFAQPRLFVGSRSTIPKATHLTRIRPGISLTKKGRGRAKKRANDGRANIRALPNYSSDPIEDFEEYGRARKGDRPQNSLFPALELT